MKQKTSFYYRALSFVAVILVTISCGNQAENTSENNSQPATRLYDAEQAFKTPVIQSKRMAQVGVIVEDIEKSAEFYARMLGIDKPVVIVAAGHESRPTMYRGNPSNATAKLAFIEFENIQFELIEPDGTPSIWQEFADNYGQGIQHIAFWVDDIDEAEQRFISAGMEVLQSGGWDGGAYSYIDATEQMGTIIELLHNYP
jgi:methylmalonyl-CoA/ethylmalonyl-CoA epimerase